MSLAFQDRSAAAPHPIDMLERTVEDNGWAFERSGRDELNLSVSGRWCDHHFCFTWRDDLASLHLSSAFDMRVTDSKRRADVAELLMHVNAKLWIGHFDLWPEDGSLIFRHAMIFPESKVSPAQCEGAAQSGGRGLRILLPGLPVRALGRPYRRRSRRRRRAGVPGTGVAVTIGKGIPFRHGRACPGHPYAPSRMGDHGWPPRGRP